MKRTHVPTATSAKKVAYSLAAGAAATGLAATDAQAAIQYSGPQNIAINPGFSQNINLDGDGLQDIIFKNYTFFGGPYQGASTFLGNSVVGFTSGLTYVSALSTGEFIGAPSNFVPFGSMAYGAANPSAQFNTAVGVPVGVQFNSGAGLLNGWVRVTINNAGGSFTINDWAYNDVAGGPILAGLLEAPEPCSLGLLAAGAVGVAAMRRSRAA